MLNGIAAAASGVVAAQKTVDVAAKNIANADTDGYKKERVTLRDTPSGVQASAERITTPGPLLARGDGPPVEGSNVELVEEMVALMEAKPAYGADLKVLKAQDEMLGSLLDLFE